MRRIKQFIHIKMGRRMGICLSVFSAFLILVLSCLSVLPAFASNAEKAAVDQDINGTIEITYAVNNKQTPLEGAEFSCDLVARYYEKGEYRGYSWEKPYKDISNPTGLSDEKLKELPSSLLSQEGENSDRTPVDKAVTDANGQCTLKVQKAGLYLVWQSGADRKASEYEPAAPLLVYVPSYDDNLEAVYNVAVEPKTNLINPPGPETPKRGAVVLKKIDADDHGVLLSGAEFDLYQKKNSSDEQTNGDSSRESHYEKVGHYSTNDKGEMAVSGLEYASYYLIETKAPDGYVLDERKIEFLLDETTSPGAEYPWQISFENRKKSENPPNTPDNNNHGGGGGGHSHGGGSDNSGGSTTQTGTTSSNPIEQIARLLPTGDESNLFLWGIVAVISAVAIIIFAVSRRRQMLKVQAAGSSPAGMNSSSSLSSPDESRSDGDNSGIEIINMDPGSKNDRNSDISSPVGKDGEITDIVKEKDFNKDSAGGEK